MRFKDSTSKRNMETIFNKEFVFRERLSKVGREGSKGMTK